MQEELDKKLEKQANELKKLQEETKQKKQQIEEEEKKTVDIDVDDTIKQVMSAKLSKK
jgi:hypothetical protein